MNGRWQLREWHLSEPEAIDSYWLTERTAYQLAEEALGEGATRVQVIDPDGKVVDDLTPDDPAVQ